MLIISEMITLSMHKNKLIKFMQARHLATVSWIGDLVSSTIESRQQQELRTRIANSFRKLVARVTNTWARWSKKWHEW